jgi:hypothetical protein
MRNLAPIAFDIDTVGFDSGAVITVAGLAVELGDIVILNTSGCFAEEESLKATLTNHSAGRAELHVCDSEHALLTTLADVSDATIDTDTHYLTAYAGRQSSFGRGRAIRLFARRRKPGYGPDTPPTSPADRRRSAAGPGDRPLGR